MKNDKSHDNSFDPILDYNKSVSGNKVVLIVKFYLYYCSRN